MATIWLSMSGEGRGHATRARTLVEALRADHRLRLFAPADAFAFLSRQYAGSDIDVVNIPGLTFRYQNEQLSLARTAIASTRYFLGLPGLVRRLRREMEQGRPDLVVCDFEPALPRAAAALGVPTLSIDHQHLFLVGDFSPLPLNLRAKARLMRTMVSIFSPNAVETVVSSFHHPPLRPGLENVTPIGPLLRPAILNAPPTDAGHLLVYLRRFGQPAVLDALRQCGLPVRIYGLGNRPPSANLTFEPLGEESFVRDLASAKAVVCNAGNQLLGETLYLGKPVLAIPEEHQDEQRINAHFLRLSGGGDCVTLREFTAERLNRFLTNLDQYRCRIDRSALRGNEAALAAIERHLPKSQAETKSQPVSAAMSQRR